MQPSHQPEREWIDDSRRRCLELGPEKRWRVGSDERRDNLKYAVDNLYNVIYDLEQKEVVINLPRSPSFSDRMSERLLGRFSLDRIWSANGASLISGEDERKDWPRVLVKYGSRSLPFILVLMTTLAGRSIDCDRESVNDLKVVDRSKWKTFTDKDIKNANDRIAELVANAALLGNTLVRMANANAPRIYKTERYDHARRVVMPYFTGCVRMPSVDPDAFRKITFPNLENRRISRMERQKTKRTCDYLERISRVYSRPNALFSALRRDRHDYR